MERPRGDGRRGRRERRLGSHRRPPGGAAACCRARPPGRTGRGPAPLSARRLRLAGRAVLAPARRRARRRHGPGQDHPDPRADRPCPRRRPGRAAVPGGRTVLGAAGVAARGGTLHALPGRADAGPHQREALDRSRLPARRGGRGGHELCRAEDRRGALRRADLPGLRARRGAVREEPPLPHPPGRQGRPRRFPSGDHGHPDGELPGRSVVDLRPGGPRAAGRRERIPAAVHDADRDRGAPGPHGAAAPARAALPAAAHQGARRHRAAAEARGGAHGDAWPGASCRLRLRAPA